MKIESINISNFRLLKDFKLDLEDTLSLVLGKIIRERHLS